MTNTTMPNSIKTAYNLSLTPTTNIMKISNQVPLPPLVFTELTEY